MRPGGEQVVDASRVGDGDEGRSCRKVSFNLPQSYPVEVNLPRFAEGVFVQKDA